MKKMSSEEIFRFMNVRPVQKINTERLQKDFALYSTTIKSPLHLAVEKLVGSDARTKANDLARQRLATSDDVKSLYMLQKAVRKASHEVNVEMARRKVEKVLGKSLCSFLESTEARHLKEILWDRFYAHTLVPEEKPEDRETVYDGIRAFHFIELLTQQKDDEKPLSIDELSSVRAILPRSLVPDPPAIDASEEKKYANRLHEEMSIIYTKFKSINKAIEDIKTNDYLYKVQELPEIKKKRAVHLTRSIQKPISEDANGTLETSGTSDKKNGEKSIVVPRLSSWVFKEFGLKNLSASTFELLSSLTEKCDNNLEAIEVLSKLEKEKYEVVSKYFKHLPPDALRFIGSSREFQEMLNNVPIPGIQFAPEEHSPDPGSPAARGIQPLGIGDLMVLKQTPLCYTAGEVAHIENVLKSEHKKRIHSRIREEEEIIITEKENIEESEKDLQTTERFELQKETLNTIERQMNIEAGVSITGSYGPVKVTAHADYATSQSSTESNRNASTFAKEITDRSINHIMRRAREVRTRRTLERFEEKNEHGFEPSRNHVIGIYRWVDKHYKSKLINYGRRLMMEFIVPEPAAFYLYVQSNKTQQLITMKKPEEPTIWGRSLTPSDLTQSNYFDFVSKYNVKGVDPYPSDMVYVNTAFAEAPGNNNANVEFAKVDTKLTIPDGYMCTDIYGESRWYGYDGMYLEVYIGGEKFPNAFDLSNIEGAMPISVLGNCTSFQINIVAACEVKEKAIEAWQLKTYEAIMNAYESALSDYYSQINASQVQAGVQIQGRNPDFNRKIERDELRKGVLRLLTDNFSQTRVGGSWRLKERFDSISTGEHGYPEFNVSEGMVEGKIIQFFEQAFEWNNITYRFSPYFWGRKSNWKDIFPLTDNDPLFTDFLRAGAARIVVPVHPAYNETVLHYLATNEIWNGGTPPTLDDPLYISIVEELKADSTGDLNDIPDCNCNKESEYPCVVDEWKVKLPTTLVYLQEDPELPDFQS